MSRAHVRLLWSVALATAATGLAGAFARHVLEPSDPFSAWSRPWQPYAEGAHALLGPLLALVLGLTLGAHALQNQSLAPKRRRAGQLLVGLVVALVASAGALSAFGSPERPLLAWTHGVLGGAFVLLFLGHALANRART